jgi:hypothetical protein
LVNDAERKKLLWHCRIVLLNTSASETARQLAPVAFELQMIEPSFKCATIIPTTLNSNGSPFMTVMFLDCDIADRNKGTVTAIKHSPGCMAVNPEIINTQERTTCSWTEVTGEKKLLRETKGTTWFDVLFEESKHDS